MRMRKSIKTRKDSIISREVKMQGKAKYIIGRVAAEGGN